MDFQKVANEVAEKILSYSQDESGWKLSKNSDTAISYTVTHSYGMGLISSRDFVDLIHIKRYEGGIITTNSVSVKYLQCPPSASAVRGHNNPCGYVCSPLAEKPTHSKLVVFIQPDLGGMLPRSIVESALPNNLINLVNDTRLGLKTFFTTAP
ncbi:stAR-related lipid transfer protein 6 [Latimeria chalumnae]|uniref:stAR-related lipid transfer protein 6 n=1 Tax=Latimeria chalumnae TaxID=7897 RepID=UPI00313B3526